MKILFNNVLLDASYSASNASANYPVDNLKHEFLRKRYQHTAASFDTVVITLDSSTDINYFFAGYSNASQVIVRLYSAAPALLKTDTLTNIGEGTKSINYGQTYSVKSIQLDVYGGSGGFLGGVGAGIVEEFPNPVGSWDEPYEDNTITKESASGQSLRNRRDPLRIDAWQFRDLTRVAKDNYKALYITYGLGSLIWIDAFELNAEFVAPMYGKINGIPITIKNGRRYDQTWFFKEAR